MFQDIKIALVDFPVVGSKYLISTTSRRRDFMWLTLLEGLVLVCWLQAKNIMAEEHGGREGVFFIVSGNQSTRKKTKEKRAGD